MKQWTLAIVLLLLQLCSYAQADIGIGGAFESPFLMNKAVGGYTHYTGVPAAKLHISYLPSEATFVPTLSVTIAPYILPVVRLGITDRALLMHFNTVNLMLQGRVRKSLNNNKELYYGIGVGATYMKGRSVSLSGNQSTYITVIEDSADYIKAIMPQVSLNVEYRVPISSEKPIGAGIGVNVLYSYYFERNTTWRMDVVDDKYNYYKLNPKLSGHMLNPSVYVVLYYRVGRKG